MCNIKNEVEKTESPDPRIEIRQIMNDQFWKMEDLAEVMQISSSAVSLLLNGKLKISMTIAVQLANALGKTAEYWLLQEMRYLGLSEGAEERVRAALYSKLPIREIRARGWIDDSTEMESIAAQICHIYGYERDSDQYFSQAGFLLEKLKQNPIPRPLNRLWMAKAKQYIGHHSGRPFNLSTFHDVEQELENIGYDDGNVQDILAVLERAGIGFYVLPRLNRMQLLGGHFMINGAPIIVYAIDGGTGHLFHLFMKMVIAGACRSSGGTFFLELVDDDTVGSSHGKIPAYKLLPNLPENITSIEFKEAPYGINTTDFELQLTRTISDLYQYMMLHPDWPERSATMAGAPIRKRIIDEKYYLEKKQAKKKG